jgi:hypothetical protein
MADPFHELPMIITCFGQSDDQRNLLFDELFPWFDLADALSSQSVHKIIKIVPACQTPPILLRRRACGLAGFGLLSR